MLCTTREHRKPRFDHNTTVGAGVVLFTVIGRTLFFVLARERYVRFWKGSLKWSGFEGASMRDETDVQTATRELREETLDSFSDTGVTDELKKGRFAMKVVASCKHTGRKHVTYLEEVGDCGPCIERFRHTRQRIQRITSLLSKLKIIQCKLETYNAHLSATGSEFPLPFPAARYVEGQDIFLVKDVLSVRFTATQMLVVFTYQPTNTGTATLEKQTCHDVRTMCDDASRYGEWFTLRGELTRLCAEVDVHCPGALECTWSGGVHPTDVKVQDADGFVQRRYFFTERQYEDERAPVQGKHFDVMLDMPPPDYSGDHLVRSFPQPSPRTRLYSVAPRYAPATRFPHRKRAAAEGRGARSTAATSTS